MEAFVLIGMVYVNKTTFRRHFVITPNTFVYVFELTK